MPWALNFGSSNTPMNGRYDTADHDYMHAKDYFNNYKFGYIERTTKTLLLQSLRPEDKQTEDLLVILNQSKSQLKSVKGVSKEASKSISELSEAIHSARARLGECEEKLHYETAREQRLEEEYGQLESLDENLRVYDELTAQFDAGCRAIQENIDRVSVLRKEIAMLSTKEAEEELKAMRAKKEKLGGRHKRLSLITMENYVEDSYVWYHRAVEFIKKMFDVNLLTVEQENNEMYLRFRVSSCEVGIFIRNGQMIDSKLYNVNDENIHATFRAISEFAASVNDPRILLMLVRHRCC